MNKFYFLIFTLISGCIISQNPASKKNTCSGFDERKYIQIALDRKIPSQDILGYVNAERNKYVLEQSPALQQEFREKVTIVNFSRQSNLAIQSTYCPNSDFSLLNYSSWAGDIANSENAGVQYPVASWLSTGFNGNNGTPIVYNTDPCNGATVSIDRHVIMNKPVLAVQNNNLTAFTNGYDPSCCNSNTLLYDLPMKPGNGLTSIRLGSAYPNYTCEKLVYAITVTPANALFTYQFAVIINDGGHSPGEQPAFIFQMKDSIGNQIGSACETYTVDGTNASIDTSYIVNSSTNTCGNSGGSQTHYRKWHTVVIDLSAYMNKTVYAEYQTLDCIYSGHFCYAYISAKCGQATILPTGFCGGTGNATLSAPASYANYQWYGPNNTTAISGATFSTYTTTNALQGDTFWVDCITLQGCTTKINIIVQPTQLSVDYSGSATGSISGGGTINLCLGDSLTLSGNGGNTYTWSGGVVNGQQFFPTVSQTYTVISDCNDTAIVNLVINCVVGINNTKDVIILEIHPNPSTGNFSINCSENIDEVKVTDILGNTVMILKPAGQSTSLQLENEGVYFVTVKAGKDVLVRKVIVNK